MDDRLTDLEVRYAYLERTVGELDQVVLELRAEVERLRRELREVREHFASGPGAPPDNEKPPHY